MCEINKLPLEIVVSTLEVRLCCNIIEPDFEQYPSSNC